MQLSNGERFAFPTQPLLDGILIGVLHCCLGQAASWGSRLANLRHRVQQVRLPACTEARSFMDTKAHQFFEFFQEEGGETFFEMAAVVPAMGAKSVGKRAAWKSNEAQLRKERARESD